MFSDNSDTVYLSLDIETGGYDKPIFAIGCAVFQINKETNEPIFLDEQRFNFIIPEKYNQNYYNEDTWKYFWSKNLDVLHQMNLTKTHDNEEQLICDFYYWYITITNKYKDLKIVTDSPTFDVGYTDSKIMYYMPLGNNSRPLVYQWKDDNAIYTSTLDYNTFELLFEMTHNKPYEKLNEIIGENPYKHDHDPLNDAKHSAYQFSKLFKYMQKCIS